MRTKLASTGHFKTYNCERYKVDVGDHGVHVEGGNLFFGIVNADLHVIGSYNTHYQLRGYNAGSYEEITAKILTAKGIKKGSTTNFRGALYI